MNLIKYKRYESKPFFPNFFPVNKLAIIVLLNYFMILFSFDQDIIFHWAIDYLFQKAIKVANTNKIVH